MRGDAEFDAIVEAIRRAGRGLSPPLLAARAAPFVDEALKKTAAAGTTPDGVPWKEKKGGGRALANAAAAISTRPIGGVIQVQLSGVEVLHHFGTAKVPRRE